MLEAVEADRPRRDPVNAKCKELSAWFESYGRMVDGWEVLGRSAHVRT
jgi:hypothetical protein